MSKLIQSTLPADTRYVEDNWDPLGKGIRRSHPENPRSVVVKGIRRRPDEVLVPGVPLPGETTISDEDAAWLSKDGHFLEHQRRGFVKFVEPA